MIASKTKLPTERYQINLIVMTSRKLLFQIKFFNKSLIIPTIYLFGFWISDPL